MNWRDFQALQKVTELGDRFLSYVDEGEGEPVVLLHGIPTWGYLWEGMLAALRGRHRVLIPDLLGFGFSDRNDLFDRSIARQAEAINLWMGKLGLERAAIVGHDIGGGTALRLAVHFPDRVGRLCLMNTVCYDSWPIEFMLQLGHPAAHRRLPAPAALFLLRRALARGFASRPGRGFVDGLLAPWRTEEGKLSLIRDASALNTNLTTELTPHLRRLRVPTLILWGEDDRFQPVEYGERLARDLPNAVLEKVRRARHFVMVDRRDAVADALGGFLAGGRRAEVEERRDLPA